MLKRYSVNGSEFWFDPKDAPEGAILLDVAEAKEAKTANKAAKPADKQRTTRTKRSAK